MSPPTTRLLVLVAFLCIALTSLARVECSAIGEVMSSGDVSKEGSMEGVGDDGSDGDGQVAETNDDGMMTDENMDGSISEVSPGDSETPVQDESTMVDTAITGENPADENPTDDSSTDESMTDENPADESETAESPTDESTIDESATDESMSDENSAEESPTTKSPTDESATDESTADKNTTDESATDESMADKNTTGKNTTDESATDESTTDESTTDDNAADSKPNIIYIMADDMGYHDVGFQNEEVISPTLDALANGGVIMNQAYAQTMCTPSRSALMTSIYPYKSKMQHGVLADLSPACVPLDLKFLPERLRDLGYTNHLLGKWHLGFCREECLPTRRGFDTFYGLWTGGETYYTKMSGEYFNMPGYDWRNQEEVDYSANGTYHSDLVATRAVEIIENSCDEPFFMFLSYANPHTPLEVPAKYKDMYCDDFTDGRRTLLGMVTAMDESVAKVMEALKESGKDKNTIIVFSSDNGGDSHGFSDSGPLRAFKGSLFEGGSRVPMFFNAPSLKKTGYRHDGLIHLADVGPTLLSMIGAPIDAAEGLDGVDQSAMVESGGASARHEIVYNFDLETSPTFGQAALRVGDWKLIWGPEGYTDGRGENASVYYKTEENQRLIAEHRAAQRCPRSQRRRKRSAEKVLSRHKRASLFFPEQDARDMDSLFVIKNFDTETMDVKTGYKYLFNLKDDPGEYNNLADNTEYKDKLMSMQYRIRDLLRDYVKPEAYRDSMLNGGMPIHNNGTYATGWCNSFVQSRKTWF